MYNIAKSNDVRFRRVVYSTKIFILFFFDSLPAVLSTSWQARSFGAKRHQAETLTSPRLLLDGAFPIPPATQISSVAARCAIAIFPRAAARWSAGSVRPAPADRPRSPCGSAAPASAPAPGGTRRRPPFSLPAALQIPRSDS